MIEGSLKSTGMDCMVAVMAVHGFMVAKMVLIRTDLYGCQNGCSW